MGDSPRPSRLTPRVGDTAASTARGNRDRRATGHRKTSRSARTAALHVLLLIAVYFADPFYIVSGSSRLSEDIVNRIQSFTYPGLTTGPRAELVRDRITVVELSDKDAEYLNLGGGFPVPLQVHGDLLRSIVCLKPAAVFVDMNFRWERLEGDAEAFADALSYRASGRGCLKLAPDVVKSTAPSVFVAHVPSDTSLCDPMAKASDIACPNREVFAPLRAVTHTVAMPGTDDTRRYVLRDAELATAATDAATSPALELYRDVCRTNPGFGPGCREAEAVYRQNAAEKRPRLAVRWGLASAESLSPEVKAACPERQRTAATSLFDTTVIAQVLDELAPALSGAERLGGAGWCPYHATLDASTVTALAARDPERLRPLIEGRIVLYGANITAVNDVVISPVLGVQPGVHLHAMSLDNLLSLGADYWRDPPEALSRTVELVLSIIAIGLGSCVGFKQERASTAGHRALWGWGVYVLPVSMLIFLTAIAAISLWHWAPINWTGLLGIVLIEKPRLFFLSGD